MARRSRQPKWLELAEGEVYLKSILTPQVMFVFLMSTVCLLLIVMVVALIFGDANEILMPTMMILGFFSTIGTTMGTKKLHLTNRRLVMEIKRKYAGEINLGEIKAIQVTKQFGGGKVLIVPARKGVGGIEVAVLKPYQFAEEIQQLSAGIPDDAEVA